MAGKNGGSACKSLEGKTMVSVKKTENCFVKQCGGEMIKNKKTLYMIGNSHIDPVWFWTWEEGMQEVKATFASALERMKEFEDFKFTCTSTAFVEWIEKLCPEMFHEIQERVREGRWEITGGWFVEPDCLLPCGEAFVRHGLYGQRYCQRVFGKKCTIGSNVDSFGHNPNLPQILKKSGMDFYVFMRPRLKIPLFVWESMDGSQVKALCLPAEYTTWFHDPTVKNIQDTLERTEAYDRMVCCYGVGNHGGGPTIENIQSIFQLKEEQEDVELRFSTYSEFFRDLPDEKETVLKGAFERINPGCYSIDAELKRKNRLAEGRMLAADVLMSMAESCTGSWMKETQNMERLWKILLFNEFHDTMGGTTILPAREEALMQISSVCAGAGSIKAAAIQNIVGSIDTRGDGFPLILFNVSGMDYDGLMETELEWFCQSPLKLCNPEGEEIPYQRIHTLAKVRHTTLGGRRRFVFQARVPAWGYSIYRVKKENSSLISCPDMEVMHQEKLILENEWIRAAFDKRTGQLNSLVEKESGYDALTDSSGIQIYFDERDCWGHPQGMRYEKSGESFRLISIEKVEGGSLRQTVRIRSQWKGTRLEQFYSLGAQEKELKAEYRLLFTEPWHLLKMAFPLGNKTVISRSETAYGIAERNLSGDICEYSMQRFLDVAGQDGAGLAVASDGIYAFHVQDEVLNLTLVRSAIYAQGNSPDWYNTQESYQYTDLGSHIWHLVLKPHKNRAPVRELYRMAWNVNGCCEYLADCVHSGFRNQKIWSLAGTDAENVLLMLIKKAEDDGSFIIRMLETEGKDTDFTLYVEGNRYPVSIGHYEVMTVKVLGESCKTVNFLEEE